MLLGSVEVKNKIRKKEGKITRKTPASWALQSLPFLEAVSGASPR